jgi:hypothetical protein
MRFTQTMLCARHYQHEKDKTSKPTRAKSHASRPDWTTIRENETIPSQNMALSTLDFELFTKGGETQRQQLGDALTESFRDHGFAKLVNHGVPQPMVEKLFDVVSHTEVHKGMSILTRRIEQALL